VPISPCGTLCIPHEAREEKRGTHTRAWVRGCGMGCLEMGEHEKDTAQWTDITVALFSWIGTFPLCSHPYLLLLRRGSRPIISGLLPLLICKATCSSVVLRTCTGIPSDQ